MTTDSISMILRKASDELQKRQSDTATERPIMFVVNEPDDLDRFIGLQPRQQAGLAMILCDITEEQQAGLDAVLKARGETVRH